MRKKQGRSVNPRKRKPKNVSQNEVTRLGGALRALGSIGGGALGNMVGMGAAGSDAGHSLGASLSKWLGSGDYELAKNSVVSRLSAGVPMMHNSGQSVTIRHKEFIGDVLSGTGTPTIFDTAFTLPLNPGLETSFPWLSSIAQQYQEYSWKGLIFHYVPTSGESVASTNTALGTVMMSTNYRATDPAFVNKQQVLNEYFSSDAKPSESFCHPIECDPKENPYNIHYVRSSGVPAGEDQKTYDLGVMRLNTVGNPAPGITLGELWCTYEVELKKPKPSGFDSIDSGICHFLTPTCITGNMFGSARTFYVNSLGLIVTSSTITFPKGTYGSYLISHYTKSPTTTYTSPGVAVTNATQVSLNLNGGADSLQPHSHTAITAETGFIVFTYALKISNPSLPAVYTTSGFAVTGSPGNADVIVTQISSDFA